mmetsp:Transcript_28722/g.84709  ORF Transcript_28722/g.84709 Transcript_28722/m.84709 type:complete len:203 (+) Transcript_28722:2840-3448(+)
MRPSSRSASFRRWGWGWRAAGGRRVPIPIPAAATSSPCGGGWRTPAAPPRAGMCGSSVGSCWTTWTSTPMRMPMESDSRARRSRRLRPRSRLESCLQSPSPSRSRPQSLLPPLRRGHARWECRWGLIHRWWWWWWSAGGGILVDLHRSPRPQGCLRRRRVPFRTSAPVVALLRRSRGRPSPRWRGRRRGPRRSSSGFARKER